MTPGDSPVERDLRTRDFTIWFGGARIGTAREVETWSPAGVALRRDEHVRFLRGSAATELATTIEIDADPALLARSVRWTERRGSELRTASARHAYDGWRVAERPQASGLRPEASEPELPDDAVPAELVPLIVRRDGGFAGDVFLPARGFVVGRGRVEAVAPGRLVARLAMTGGAIVEATIDLDRDGAPARVVDGEGVIAIRATAQQAAEPFPAVDLIAATSIAIAGHASHRLVLDGEAELPAVPGQLARTTTSGIEVELGRHLPGALPAGAATPDRTAEIRALVAQVRRRITPDLRAAPTTAREALGAATGDCTTFALAYAALAAERGIASRVVTGLRVDGDHLVRHRWAISWTGRAWIAVDVAFGAAPAGGDLIGLAVHDADDAGLVAGEAALTQIHAARWN